jgi:HEAT repeat protein
VKSWGWLRGLVGGFVLVSMPGVSAADASEPAGNDRGGALFVDVRGGLLTVKARGAPLAEVLEAVAARANVRAVSHGEVRELVTIEFERLPLEEGLKRLLRRQNHLLIYGREGLDAPTLGVWLYPSAAGPSLVGEDATVEQWVRRARSGSDQTERSRAIHGLASLGGESAAAALDGLLRQEPDAALRVEAARALARIGGPRAASALEPGLGDPESRVRQEVIRALRRSNDEAAAAPLTRTLLTDQDPGVRREAALALSRLGESAAWDGLQSGRRDLDASVRATVEHALRRWAQQFGTGER